VSYDHLPLIVRKLREANVSMEDMMKTLSLKEQAAIANNWDLWRLPYLAPVDFSSRSGDRQDAHGRTHDNRGCARPKEDSPGHHWHRGPHERGRSTYDGGGAKRNLGNGA